MDFPSAHSRKEGPAETLNPEFPWSLDAFITTDAIALSLSERKEKKEKRFSVHTESARRRLQPQALLRTSPTEAKGVNPLLKINK